MHKSLTCHFHWRAIVACSRLWRTRWDQRRIRGSWMGGWAWAFDPHPLPRLTLRWTSWACIQALWGHERQGSVLQGAPLLQDHKDHGGYRRDLASGTAGMQRWVGTSFQMHKWLPRKMYTTSDTIFWHSISCFTVLGFVSSPNEKCSWDVMCLIVEILFPKEN